APLAAREGRTSVAPIQEELVTYRPGKVYGRRSCPCFVLSVYSARSSRAARRTLDTRFAMEVQLVRSRKLFALASLAISLLAAWLPAARGADSSISSGEAEWIWAPSRNQESSAAAVCYFRKTFDVNNAESARVNIACDDRYELYVNGRRVGAGSNWKVLD